MTIALGVSGLWNWALIVGVTTADGAMPRAATPTPHFARQFGVSCSRCHVSPPKLNAYGEEFVANGYEMPELRSRRTVPLAVWVSARSERLPGVRGPAAEASQAYINRVELISGGKVVAPWMSYFVEWRAISRESRSDGTLRDRSGRFEDLFVTASRSQVELTIGQFRQIGQVDVSRRPGLSEPLALSASLPSTRSEGTSRQRALRAFSPSGRSPAARVAWVRGGGQDSWRWSTSAGLPLSGEFSIPLNSKARVEASNELEWRPKGVVLESFLRRGVVSLGAHAFYDDRERYLTNVVATGGGSSLHWTAVTGVWRTGGSTRGQWSLESEYFPSRFVAFGARVEDRAADGAGRGFLPYVNLHFPGTRGTIRFTVERRFQRGRNATFVELAPIF
ncbi:MAG: hypothetical protein ACT4OZ_08695 [Gemmatimonadota bacterium]